MNFNELNRPDFEAALDANPADWSLRLIYADWLDERGEVDAAYAQRWMAEHGRCPVKVIRPGLWGVQYWWEAEMRKIFYNTRVAAEAALAEALKQTKEF